ncbi:hypothetical protein BJ912DRAFT_453169 [Pholiota molesta]|nr:hypothetical protein BJ912DRAFT_453169 [Pholiota molesta]
MIVCTNKTALPFEILQEIFYWTRHFRDPFERMNVPIILASVCSLWRSIVFQTSSLWSTIVVSHVVHRRRAISNVPDDCHDDALDEFERIKFFLKNSRQSLLDIYVQLTTSNRDKTSSVWCPPSPILRGGPKSSVSDLALIIAPHARRFRRFHVLSTRYSPVKELLSTFPQVAMPCLEELHIDRVHRLHSQLHSDCPRTCPEPLAFLNIHHITAGDAQDYFHDNFPALKSIALASIPLLLPVFTPTNLTSLKMALPQLDLTIGLRNLLAANAHSLEKLSFMATHTLSAFEHRQLIGSVSSDNLISFPLVTKLEISYADPDTFIPLVSTVRFPSLTSLRITSMQRTISFPTKQFFEILCDSIFFDRVEELNLENIFTDHTPLSLTDGAHSRSFYPYHILDHLTSLRTFTVTGIDRHILHHLNSPITSISSAAAPHKTVSLPSLTHLHLIPTNGTAGLESLMDFFRQRLSLIRNTTYDGPSLHELSISGPPMWAHDLKAIDLRSLARHVLFLCPTNPRRSGGIWDEELPIHSAIDLSGENDSSI